jgi:sarcosine oxidase
MIAVTPDDQFLIGRPGNDRRLLIGGGCSGHGFKHATGIGELLAQMALGDEPFMNADFVDPNRFDSASQLRKAS